MTSPAELFPPTKKPAEALSGVTVRLAGDSGDGMQLLGTQLTNTSALSGNDVATFPDFPAEIRAPALASAVFRFSFPPRKFSPPATASIR